MKKVLLCIKAIILLIGVGFGYLKYRKFKTEQNIKKKHDKLVKDINNNYNKNVITNRDTAIYILKNKKYIKAGTISKDLYLEIEKLTSDDPYYKIVNTSYYLSYKDVTKNETKLVINDRYKNFIPFDNNVMIKKGTNIYLDGKINIPYNSIVLTIDDGYISDKAIRLLEQYETYATLFIITGHFQDFSKFSSPYLDLQSHTDGMHKQYACSGMGNQGGGILCAKEDDAIADLQLSQEKLGGKEKVIYLSYPFFDFNDHAIEILKKAGFKMAFIGQWNVNGFSTVGTNKYKVPRLTTFNDTTVESLKQALKY